MALFRVIQESICANDVMIVYNNQQQLTRLCSFQVVLQSPLRNNGIQGQQAIINYKASVI